MINSTPPNKIPNAYLWYEFVEISNHNDAVIKIDGIVENTTYENNNLFRGYLSIGNYSRLDNSNIFGSGFVGDIGEFIYFNRRLNLLEYKSVKNYLSRKWFI